MQARFQQCMHIVWILRIDNIEGFTITTWNLKSTSYKFPNHETLLLLVDNSIKSDSSHLLYRNLSWFGNKARICLDYCRRLLNHLIFVFYVCCLSYHL